MDSLTDVPGLRVGHATVPGGGSGCTVVLGPFRGRVEVHGMAAGTRELEPLRGAHLVPRVDAVLLTGGSAFGLAAADGVMGWLRERNEGYETGVATVPIVPAAVIFDLAPDRRIPGPDEGRAACEAAGTGPVPAGGVGAGSGARVGKLLGPARSSPGGLGSAASAVRSWTVGALAVVNALGNVVDRRGRIAAGARGEGGFVDGTAKILAAGRRGEMAELMREQAEGNTTLGVVATDAPLSVHDLERLLRMAATALPRRIDPVYTPFDGDMVFGLGTAEDDRPGSFTSAEILALGLAAREALETAILRAVGAGEEET